jgi:hypothetical protein
MGVKFNTIVPKVDVLRFNHYNINDKQLKWMKEFYKSTSEFKINGKDHGMIRYKDIFNRDTV